MSVSKEAIEAASAGYIGDDWATLNVHTQDHVRTRMKAALEAALPFLPIAVEGKEGWQLVPVEPTDEMLEAAEDDISEKRSFGMQVYASDVWEKMLAAAPVPPSSPGKDGGQEVEAVDGSKPVRWQRRTPGTVGGTWSLSADGWVDVDAEDIGRYLARGNDIRPLYASPLSHQPASTALVEALEPFSRAAGELFARNWNASQVVMSFSTENGILKLTAGDFFAVRSTLSVGEARP